MLDFDYLARLNSRAPWLFIGTRERSAGFLLVIAFALIFVVRFETGPYWNRLANTGSEPKRGSHLVLLQTISSTLADDHKDLVVILGGSVTQQLTADDSLVSKDLSKRCRQDIRFANLASVGQTFDESWDIVSLMPAERTRLVLMGIGSRQISIDDADVISNLHPINGIPVSYSLLWLVFRKTGHLGSLERAATAIIRQVQMGAAREPQKLLWSQPPIARPDSADPYTPLRDIYGRGRPILSNPEKLRWTSQYISARVFDLHTKVKSGVLWWNRFRGHFNRRGTAVRFVVPPTDQTFRAAEQLTDKDLESALKALGAGSVLDLRRVAVELSSDDFYDGEHLIASGREKLHPTFVDEVAEALGCTPDGPK